MPIWISVIILGLQQYCTSTVNQYWSTDLYFSIHTLASLVLICKSHSLLSPARWFEIITYDDLKLLIGIKRAHLKFCVAILDCGFHLFHTLCNESYIPFSSCYYLAMLSSLTVPRDQAMVIEISPEEIVYSLAAVNALFKILLHHIE